MLTLGNKLTLNSQPIYHFVNKYSIDFDGVDDCIITDGADTVAQNSTYSMWIKSSTTTENFGVFGHGSTNIGAFHLNSNDLYPMLYLGSNYWIKWNENSAQDDGEWHHYVVYLATNLTDSKLYIDGVLQTKNTTLSSGSLSAYTESLTIGSDRQVGGNSFEGKIDEFAVYDRELTQDEITRMYNTYYSPNRVANGNFSQIGNEEVTNGDFSEVGSEEITNGDFATDSDWTKDAGWTIANGVASCDGTQTSGTELMQTGLTFTNTKIYKVTYTITVNAGTINTRLKTGGSTVSGPSRTTSGTYTDYLVSTGNTTFRMRGHIGFIGTVDNVSAKEVGQDYNFGTGWTMGDGKAVSLGSNEDAYLSQNNTFVAGKIYKVTFDVNDYTSGTLSVRAINEASALAVTSTGSYVVYIKPISNISIGFRSAGTGGYVGSVDNISVKEVGQHWTFGTGWSVENNQLVSVAGTAAYTTQSGVGIIGRTYKVIADVAEVTSGLTYVYTGQGGTYYTINSAGVYTFSVVWDSISSLGIYKNASFAGKYNSITIQELKHDATNLMLNAGAYQSANPLITSTKSMEFDGTDDSLQLGSFINLGVDDFSLSFWVNLDSATNITFAIKFEDNSNRVVFSTNGANQLSTQGRIGGAYAWNFVGTGTNVLLTPHLNKWTHIAYSIDRSSNLLIFINGELKSTTDISSTASTNVDNTGNWSLGDANGYSFLNGKMTEVGAYNRALTSLEVASLYNQGMPTNLLVNRNNYQSGNPTVFNTKQVDFDGTDDYLDLGSQSATSSLTYSAWVNVDANTSNVLYYGKTIFRCNTTTELKYWSDVTQSNITLTVDDYFNKWTHFVVTQTGTTYTIYQNGIQKGTGTVAAVSTTQDNSYIGRFSTQYFNGKISQVGIFNEALTADEVSSLYNHGLPIDLTTDQAAYESSSNLVGYWRMGSGTLDTYPLIADQTNATLGSNLVVNGTFETEVTSAQWLNFGSPTTAERSTTYAYEGTHSYHIVGDGTNDGTQAAAPQFTGDYTVGDVVKITAYVYPITASSNQIKTGVNSSNRSITSSYNVVLNEWNKIEYYVTISTASNNYITFLISGSAGEFYLDNVSTEIVGGNPAIMTNQTSSDIENGSPYANIVQNGTFDTDTDWAKQAGWTISGGTANFVEAGGNRNIYQNILTLGKTYKLTYTVLNYVSGAIRNVSANPYIERTANGTYTETFVAVFTNLYLKCAVNSQLSIDNVTVEEVNTGLQGYWKMGDGTNDEYPVIYDQTNPTLSAELVTDGNFPTGTTAWYLDDIVTISNNEAIITGNGIVSNGQFYQTVLNIEAGSYLFTFDYNNVSGNSIRVNADGTLKIVTTVLGDTGTYTAIFTPSTSNPVLRFYGYVDNGEIVKISNVSFKKLNGNAAYMTNMVEGNITNQYPLTKIRNYYRMGDGILDGYPIIQDQTSPNLAHIPTTNLVTYSEDFSQWDTIQSTLTANYGISPDGTQNSTRCVFSGANQQLRQSVTTSASSTGSIYIKGVNEETIKFGVQGSESLFTLNGEWQRIQKQGTVTSNRIVINTYSGATARDIQIWGAQLENQSQATAYIKSDGIAAVRKATTTNLIPYSEDFSQSDWTKQNTTVESGQNGIYNTTNAWKLISLGNNNDKIFDTITNTGLHTASVYVKKGNVNFTAIEYGGFAYFNLENGTIGSSGSIINAIIESVGNGWYRCSITLNITSTTNFNIYVIATNGSTNTTNGDFIYIQNAQVEQQTQAETYAKTTGLPVTIDLFTENNYGTMTNMSASDIVEDTPNN